MVWLIRMKVLVEVQFIFYLYFKRVEKGIQDKKKKKKETLNERKGLGFVISQIFLINFFGNNKYLSLISCRFNIKFK